MTLLVDNQLPLALARFLAINDWVCIHVQDVGLETADDQTIWQYAKERGLTIVTKDEDFQALATRQGSVPPPRILPALRDMLAAGDAVVEIR